MTTAMITKKALEKLLAAAQKSEDEGPCWCTDEDCEYGHEEDLSTFPSHVITFVTPDGNIDVAENKKYLTTSGWGLDGPFDYVIEHTQEYPDDAERMVVVERASGQWYPATSFL